MPNPTDFIMVPVPVSDYRAVCAVLAGVSLGAPTHAAPPAAEGKSVPVATTATTSDVAPSGASESSEGAEIDAHGHPWNGDIHASTMTKTKDGLWRLKPGASRPDPLPGYPVEGEAETEAEAETETEAEAETEAPPAEDDEFAAFREAAAESEESEPEPRKWTEADISKLCNQAAVKLGDPGPVKNIIAKYVPEGQTPHSRNIPEDVREAFAQEVEKKADIEFAA